MRFIKKVIAPDEHLLGIVSVHWIYGAKGLLWLLLLSGGTFLLDILLTSFFGLHFGPDGAYIIGNITNIVFWAATALGVVMFLFYFIMMITTELGLTDQRIIYKKGLILVDVKEVDLEEIKAADIDHGVLGRFLNYGYIRLDARFIKDMFLPAIAKPYRFMKAMNDMRARMKEEGSLHHILEEHHRYNGQKHQEEEKEKEEEKNPSIDDPRYETFNSNPLEALEEVINETKEGARIHEKEAKEQISVDGPKPPWAEEVDKEVEEDMKEEGASAMNKKKEETQPQTQEQNGQRQKEKDQKSANKSGSKKTEEKQISDQENKSDESKDEDNKEGPVVFETTKRQQKLKKELEEDFARTVH